MYLCYDRSNQLPLTSTPNPSTPQKVPLNNGPSCYQDGLKLLLLAIQAESCDPPPEKSFTSIPFPPPSWIEDKPKTPVTSLPSITWEDEKVLSSDDDKDSSAEGSSGRDNKTCTQCGATETPKWRRGMSDDGVLGVRLCNACGIRSKRLMRRKSPKHSHSKDKKRQKELKKAYLREKKSRQYAAYRLPPPSYITLPPLIRSHLV